MTPENDTFARVIAEVEARCGGNKDMMIGMLAQRVVTLRAALEEIRSDAAGEGGLPRLRWIAQRAAGELREEQP